MPLRVALHDLPQRLPTGEAVALAYPSQLAELAAALSHGLPCVVECAKEMVPFVFLDVRARLQSQGCNCVYVDGRPAVEEKPVPPGLLGRLVTQLREAVRGPLEKRVVFLPHLDLMTSNPGTLTAEAREVVALLLEDPHLVWVGFRDPALPLPRVVEDLALYRLRLLGVERSRLRRLVTRAEGRKFGEVVDLGALHRQLSGVNAVRLRRLLSTLDREDLPADPGRALAELRRLTLADGVGVPEATFADVGGYAAVKQRLRDEVLAVLDGISRAETDEERRRSEELLPRCLLLTGAAGAVKRQLAQALANAVGAAFLETTGAELKSRYVGGSEENVRQLFLRARQAAPALVLFHDLDAFAAPPGRAAGPGEPSLLSQLVQELDGLPRGELVLVVGTARGRADVAPALLQPGRFELVLKVGAPTTEDRRAILERLDRALDLRLSPEALERAVRLTAEAAGPDGVPGQGERPEALARALARQRLREGRQDATRPEDVERAMAAL